MAGAAASTSRWFASPRPKRYAASARYRFLPLRSARASAQRIEARNTMFSVYTSATTLWLQAPCENA
jgi:hypothetical protein